MCQKQYLKCANISAIYLNHNLKWVNLRRIDDQLYIGRPHTIEEITRWIFLISQIDAFN